MELQEDIENWMTRIKHIFDVIEVAEGDRVKLATFMLSEEAHRWWKAAERVLTATPVGPDARISWNQFEEAFNEKYFSAFYQSEKSREFMLLVQGSIVCRRVCC